MASKPDDTHRQFGPDLIRATAILCVAFSHTIPGLTTLTAVRMIRGVLGYVGVEIFFVLSGFLIGGILLKQLSTGGLETMAGVFGFWKRRWFRTLPNYYLFLVLYLVLTRCSEGSLPPGVWKFFWFGEALSGQHPTFFTVAWSLAVEEWFYFCFPLVLWLAWKLFRNRPLAFWITVAIFLLVPPVLRLRADTGNWDDGVRKMTLFRLDAIMFGVVLSFIKVRQARAWSLLRRAWPIGVAGLAGTLGYAFVVVGLDVNSFFGRVLCFSFTSLSLSLIFPVVTELSTPREILAVPIRKISLWSYSMYLSHAWLGQLFNTLFHAAGWSVHGLNAVVLSSLDWVAMLTFSALLYSWYEKPLMDLRDRPSRSTPPPVGADSR